MHAIKPAVQTATFEPGDLVLSRKLFGADLYLVVGTEKEIWALPCHAHKISESVIGSNAGKNHPVVQRKENGISGWNMG